MRNNASLISIAALFSVSIAQAREATILQFGQPLNAIWSARTADENIAVLLREHLEAMALPIGQVQLPTQNGFASPLQTARPSDCGSTVHNPVWWLPAEVRKRRAIHIGTVASIACEFNIPPNLLDALIAQESGYRPWAISRAGAMGMTQILPGTARSLGLVLPFDPVDNVRAGARYLRRQLDRFGRVDLALAAYNAGPERRSLAAGYVPNIPETVNYVRTITTNWVRLTQLNQPDSQAQLRESAANLAVRASGYREVTLNVYDGMNSANPI